MENADDYQVQSRANEAIFWNLIQKTMPDFYVLMREIKDSEVNPFVLTKIARALALIANGTKYGKVMTIVENGTATFIYGEEANKINEPVIKKVQLP